MAQEEHILEVGPQEGLSVKFFDTNTLPPTLQTHTHWSSLPSSAIKCSIYQGYSSSCEREATHTHWITSLLLAEDPHKIVDYPIKGRTMGTLNFLLSKTHMHLYILFPLPFSPSSPSPTHSLSIVVQTALHPPHTPLPPSSLHTLTTSPRHCLRPWVILHHNTLPPKQTVRQSQRHLL